MQALANLLDMPISRASVVDEIDPGPAAYPVPQGRLLVSMATYNERDNLSPLIEAVHAVAEHADILVVDDGSPDGTGQIVEELAARDRRVNLLQRGRKLGLGTATLAAMRFAMDRNYDFLLNLDADFSHPPRYIPAILAGMFDHDLMIGSRYVPGGGTENWPFSRRMISKSVNFYVRTLLRMPVRDASGAFRCYRVAKLREAQLERVRSRGYSFQQEVLFRCHRAGCRIGEHPIIFENRKAGTSKVNLRESVNSILMLTRLGLRAAVGLEK